MSEEFSLKMSKSKSPDTSSSINESSPSLPSSGGASLYPYSSSSSKSFTSLSSKSLTSSSGSSTVESNDRNTFRVPQKQVHTSSSDPPSDSRVISLSVDSYQPHVENQDGGISGSQDLFSTKENNKSLKFNTPSGTSTPFIKDSDQVKTYQADNNSFHLSGNSQPSNLSLHLSGESQPSYIHATSKEECVTSPTTGTIKFSLSSSSSEDEKNRLKQRQQQRQQQRQEQEDSLKLPLWFEKESGESNKDDSEKQHSEENKDSLETTEEHENSEEEVQENNTSNLDLIADDSPPVEHKPDNLSEEYNNSDPLVVTHSELIMGGESKQINQDSCEVVENSQPVEMNFALSQDFSQNVEQPQPSQVFAMDMSNSETKDVQTASATCTTRNASTTSAHKNKQSRFVETSGSSGNEYFVPSKESSAKSSSQNINDEKLDEEAAYRFFKKRYNIDVNLDEVNFSGNGIYLKYSTKLAKSTKQQQQPAAKVATKLVEEKPAVEKSEEEVQLNVTAGMRVFASWGSEMYYPGTVKEIKKSSGKAQINFDDGTATSVPFDGVFLQNKLAIHQEVEVKQDDSYYYEAVIINIKKNEEKPEEFLYEIKMNGEEATRWVSVSLLCLTEAQKENLFSSSSVQIKDKNTKSRKRSASQSIEVVHGERKKRRGSTKKVITQEVKLFTDFYFFITQDDSDDTYSVVLPVDDSASELSERDDSPDVREFDVVDLEKKIVENGGQIIPSLNQRDLRKAKNIICLANKPLVTLKYLYCVAKRYHILDFNWVYISIGQNSRQNYPAYSLPAGIDITGAKVEQDFKTTCTPLGSLMIYFHLGKNKKITRDLNTLLRVVGCDRVHENYTVTKKTKKVPFSMRNIDFICNLDNKIPTVLWEAAKEAGIRVVTTTWLIQCLITNQLLDIECSPTFLYQHLKKCNSDSDSSNNVDRGAAS